MLENNQLVKRKMTAFTRLVALLLPIVCVTLLLTQTVFAKTIYLINDGGRVTIHTTYATNPAEVLDEAGLDLGEDDTYTTQPGFAMSEITIQRTQTVHISYMGENMTVNSYGETVEELLTRLDLTLTEGDVISAAKTAMTFDGMELVVSRMETVEENHITSIPYETRYCYDVTLRKGEQKVLTEGMEGVMEHFDSVRYLNGQEVGRTELEQRVIAAPVHELIAVGLGAELTEEETFVTEPTELPEEQGALLIGDGFLITADGEMLTFSHSEIFKATAYHNTDPGCTIYTAIGTLCRVGAIAVDPKVIPYGTKMFIVTNDGRYIYGEAVAEDCGSAIKGNRVDLYFDTVAECERFGVRDCTIYFLN